MDTLNNFSVAEMFTSWMTRTAKGQILSAVPPKGNLRWPAQNQLVSPQRKGGRFCFSQPLSHCPVVIRHSSLFP